MTVEIKRKLKDEMRWAVTGLCFQLATSCRFSDARACHGSGSVPTR